MNGDMYEDKDLVDAVRVRDGFAVRVPGAWLEEGHPCSGTYAPVDASGPEPEPEVEEPPVKTRARRASDT